MWESVHHFFIPHTRNNHRAKALHPDSLLVYLLIFAVFNFVVRTVHRQFPDVLGYATDIHVQELLDDTNAQRKALGLTTLTLNDELSKAAERKARDMFADGYWAHTSPSGKTPWEFILGAGYKYSLAGENLAKNFSTSQGVVDAWMASPTHRDNIVKPGYRDVGYAVVNGILNGEETTLVVQMFGATEKLADTRGTPAQPVEVPAQSLETGAAGEGTVRGTGNQSPALVAVTKTPVFNLPSLTRDIAFLFVGLMMGVLALDLYVVSRKQIVRVTGHNIAHMLFLAALIVAAISIQRGSLL
jgi:hypothetical protein